MIYVANFVSRHNITGARAKSSAFHGNCGFEKHPYQLHLLDKALLFAKRREFALMPASKRVTR
jgi:hypothetical protein